MNTGVILAIVLGVLGIFTFLKHAVFSLPKWKMVYFSIVDEINVGEDENKIKSDLVKRYKLTPEQAEAAITAAKNGDMEWFESAIWR